MTPAEFRDALDALSDAEYQAFCNSFGSEARSREAQVTLFVHRPEHERLISHLLGMETESEKMVAATQASAKAAKSATAAARISAAAAAAAALAALTALLF